MNIQPIQYYNNYNNVSMQGKDGNSWKRFKNRVAQKILDALPSHTQKESARTRDEWNKFDNWISKPAQNRAIMGLTAIITQPAIDYHNHKVDDETRRISRNRTIAKIIAGTFVGILVRGSAYKAVESMTNIEGKSKLSKKLLPKKFLGEIAKNEKFLKNHRCALSNWLAISVMCVTNFVLDAPLTVFLTNRLNSKQEEEKHE